MYLDQNQEADSHLGLVQSEELLRGQGDKVTAVGGARVASTPGVAVALTSDAAFSQKDRCDRLMFKGILEASMNGRVSTLKMKREEKRRPR